MPESEEQNMTLVNFDFDGNGCAMMHRSGNLIHFNSRREPTPTEKQESEELKEAKDWYNKSSYVFRGASDEIAAMLLAYLRYREEKKWVSVKEIKLFKMNDYDWWAARSIEEAVQDYKTFCGEDGIKNPHELSEEEMNRLIFKDDDGESRTFNEQLKKEIDRGAEFPCMFASTEY